MSLKVFKKYLLFPALVLIAILFFSQCFFVNRYMKSDAELEAHYRLAPVKPSYRHCESEGRTAHYAVISCSDTLPLLVMVHGAPGAWYGYMNLTDDTLLQKNFKMVAVDRLGYGKSDYGKEELSIERQAIAIQSVIEKENTSGKKVYLLGRSYGAPIAAWLAIHSPETFEKLVMVSPVIDPDKEKFYWFSDIGRWPLVQWMLPEMLNVATREKFSHAQEMKKLLPEWAQLKTPTYVLVGEEDAVADTANYSFARKNITNCSAMFMKLAHTGHQITRQQPDLIKTLLLSKDVCEENSFIAQEKN
jgi:pimeloyl-ACP methyl ester carboxylesterase